MKVFFFINYYFFYFRYKICGYRSDKPNKKLEKEIYKIDGQIEKLKTDYSYVSSPQNLKKMNQTELKLYPIQQIDIIKLQDK